MSLKRRLDRLEKRHALEWEAPFFITFSQEDAPRIDVLREQYREEIERDKARGRLYFGLDFRCHEPEATP